MRRIGGCLPHESLLWTVETVYHRWNQRWAASSDANSRNATVIESLFSKLQGKVRRLACASERLVWGVRLLGPLQGAGGITRHPQGRAALQDGAWGARGGRGRPCLVGMYEPPPRASRRLAPAVSALPRTPGGHGPLQGAGGATRRLQGAHRAAGRRMGRAWRPW